jgi:hypothetical protein
MCANYAADGLRRPKEGDVTDDLAVPHVGGAPTDAEIEAWAMRERHRREQWARGPTPEQTALWAIREHERRTFAQGQPAVSRGGSLVSVWPIRRTLRDIRLAGIGALRLAVNTSVRDTFDYLVRMGLDWEDEVSRRSETR